MSVLEGLSGRVHLQDGCGHAEPLGALGMDLVHTYDAVKIRVNVHTAHFTHTL